MARKLRNRDAEASGALDNRPKLVYVPIKRTALPPQALNPEVLETNMPALANGRKVVLGIINTILTDKNNIRTLHGKMQDEFDQNPVGFYQDIVFPLMPKQLSLEAEGEGNKKAKLNIVLTTDG